jgi:hypothetical protein
MSCDPTDKKADEQKHGEREGTYQAPNEAKPAS